MKKNPYVVAILGPNGSGKTSLLDEIKKTGLKGLGGTFPMPTVFINPDQFSKDLQGSYQSQEDRDKAAFKKAIDVRQAALEAHQTFAFESVASHTSRIGELISLKEAGYCVLLVFITTDNPDTNVARVKFRFETGATTGHWVPEDKVRSRYRRTLMLLPKAAEVADVAFVYDNSGLKPIQQAVIDGASFNVIPKAANWVRESLVHRGQSRVDQMNEIDDTFGNDPDGLIEANPLNASYQGPIKYVSNDYVVMFDEEQERYVIHDRIMLDTDVDEGEERDYQEGDCIIITYETMMPPMVDFKH